MITLRQLRYLRALADAGHFGRAAAQVQVSQPALSVQIKTLEEALGASLIERRSRSFVLTPLGREVAARAEGVLAQVRDIEQLARLSEGPEGRVILGVIPTIAPYLLPHALPQIRDAGMTHVGVREAKTDTLLEELDAGRLDAAVIALPAPVPGLVETPLFKDRFLLAGQLSALGREAPPDALTAEMLLLLEDGHCLTDQVVQACAIDPSRVRADLRASSLTTLCHLAAQGLGVTLLPEIALKKEAGAQLETRRFAGAEPYRDIGIVRRKMSGPVPWFDTLATAFRDAAAIEHS